MNRYFLPTSLICIALILMSTFAGCTKFEEGPNFSFRTKKGRISNDWKVDKGYINGIEATESLNNFFVTFKRDGAVKFTYVFPLPSGDSTTTIKGAWDFVSDDEVAIVLNDDGVVTTRLWKLLRLTSDELRAVEILDSNVVKYHMVDK